MLRAEFHVSTLRSLSRRQAYAVVLDWASSPPVLEWYKMRRGVEVKRSFTFQSCIRLEKNNKDPTCLIVAFASPGNAVPVAPQPAAASVSASASASASAAAGRETAAASVVAPAAVSSSGSSVWQKVVFFSSADDRELFCDLVHAAIVSGDSAVRLYRQLDQQKARSGGGGGAAAAAAESPTPPSPSSASLSPALQSLVGADFCSFLIAYSAAQTQLDSSAIARANTRSTQGAATSGSAAQQQRDASTTVASVTSSNHHHSQPSDSRLIADKLLQAHALDAEAARAGGAGGGAGSGNGEQRGVGGGVEEMFGFQLLEGEVVVMQCPHTTRLDSAAAGGAGGDVRSWEATAVALPPPSPAAAAASSSRPASPSAASSSSSSCRGNLFITNYRLIFREYRAAAGDRPRSASSASLSSCSSSAVASSSALPSSSSSAAFAAASFPFLFPSASFSSPTADFELTLGAILRLFPSPSSSCCLVVVSKDNRRLELGFDNGSDWVQSLVSQLHSMAFRPVSKLFAFEHGKAIKARRKERREAKERRAEERRRRREVDAADADDDSVRDERDGWTLEPQQQQQQEQAEEEEDEVDGWSLYSPAAEYARLGLLSGGLYRLSTANATFSLCPTYPPCFVTPAIISDSDLASIASHRSQQRLPAIVYLHPLTGATLSRSAQPLVGVRGKRNELDEALISVLRRSSPCNSSAFVIMDARPYKAAMGNAVMGKGYESTAHYERSSLVFCGIDNIHHIRHSLDRLNAICSSGGAAQGGAAQPLAASAGGAVGGAAVAGVSAAVGGQTGGVEDSQWLLRLDATQWLHYIRLLLSAAVRIAICLSVDGCSVLARCSDGWDRTAQLTSLTLLMLDPYHRTMRGFAVLVEKEWLSFGHHFSQRHGQGSADWEDSQRAPIFLQWLDCVWQLMRQFPAAFEFNEEMLVDLWDAMIGNCYGSFLFDSQKEREEAAVRTETESVWTVMLSATRRDKYVNPLYQHRAAAQPAAAQRRVDIIDLLASSASASSTSPPSAPSLPLSYCIPNVSAKRLVLWERFHLRWDREYVRTFLSSSPLTGRRQQQDREQRRILRNYHTMRSLLQRAGVDVDALDTEDDGLQLGATEAAAEKGREGSGSGGSSVSAAKDRKAAAARTLSAQAFARAGRAAQADDGGSAAVRVRPALHLNTFSPPTPTAGAESDSAPSVSLSISAAGAKEELGTEEQKR